MFRTVLRRSMSTLAATIMAEPRRNPLIAIVGATGTGKSELAVAIAKRYNGEVINADAMQLYDGLPVITNKITESEQQGIPHHLLGCIGLHEPTWVVGTFVRRATEAIEEIRARGKLPILVGGTHYYTQNLLFQDRLTDVDQSSPRDEALPDLSEQWPILKEATDVLLAELKKVDPVMADRWHPNDRRKIQRSLEIYLQTGKKASAVYAEQRENKNKQSSDAETSSDEAAPHMRFDTLLLWVHAESEALHARLNGRVDQMLSRGLLEEVQTLESLASRSSAEGNLINQTQGIWISIGYKEFKAYAQALKTPDMAPATLEKLRKEAVEMTKSHTRQYSKSQISWIRIKLANALHNARAQDRLYLLDSSDASQYEEKVVNPAISLTEKFLSQESMPSPDGLSDLAAAMLKPKRDYDISLHPQRWIKQHCECCNVTCVLEDQWQRHLKSKAHRKLTRKYQQQRPETSARPVPTPQECDPARSD